MRSKYRSQIETPFSPLLSTYGKNYCLFTNALTGERQRFKKCRGCGNWFPADTRHFSRMKMKRAWHYLQPNCRACHYQINTGAL